MIAPAKVTEAPSTVAARDYLSFSAIRAYQTCPLRYFFRYRAGLPEESVSASLVFGAAVHRAVEHHFRELLAGNPPPSLQALLDAYRSEWRERDGTPIHFAKEDNEATLEKVGERILAAFREHEIALPAGTILAVEETLRGSVIPGLPDILGKVDLIVETQDELIISDWKTSRSRWSTEQVEEAAEQLLLYSELAADFAPGKTIRIEFAVLTKTKEVSIERYSSPVDSQRVDRIKRVIERVWNAIEDEHFYPAPSPMSCGGCPFREPCRKWPG
jgi:putative RecB family exonuclease